MGERLNRIRNGVRIDGHDVSIDGADVEIILEDDAELILFCRGENVPDADAGFAKGCIFIKTNAGSGVKALYENQGTSASCSFNLIGNIDTAEINDGAVTEAKLASGLEAIKYQDVSITVAEIKALRATPIELVPATEAGAGYAIIPLAINLNLHAGSEALSESSDNLAVKCSTTELIEVETTGFIDQTSDQNRYQEKAEAVITPIENTAIVLANKGDGEFAGNASDDASLDVRIYYRVVPVL